jgi:hypothetical protein
VALAGCMYRTSWRICRWGKCNVVDAAMSVVGRGGDRQGEVAIDAVALVGVDVGCVGVELYLHHLDHLKGGLRVCCSQLGEYLPGREKLP